MKQDASSHLAGSRGAGDLYDDGDTGSQSQVSLSTHWKTVSCELSPGQSSGTLGKAAERDAQHRHALHLDKGVQATGLAGNVSAL
jgi:hypothetical protein